jgi:hypothetical protein
VAISVRSNGQEVAGAMAPLLARVLATTIVEAADEVETKGKELL